MKSTCTENTFTDKQARLDHISNKALRDQGPVYFEGILRSFEESWLSEDGKNLLCQDIANVAGIEEQRAANILERYKPEVIVVGVLFGEPYGFESTS